MESFWNVVVSEIFVRERYQFLWDPITVTQRLKKKKRSDLIHIPKRRKGKFSYRVNSAPGNLGSFPHRVFWAVLMEEICKVPFCRVFFFWMFHSSLQFGAFPDGLPSLRYYDQAEVSLDVAAICWTTLKGINIKPIACILEFMIASHAFNHFPRLLHSRFGMGGVVHRIHLWGEPQCDS